MNKYRAIGILGGMGPQATAELYLRIIKIFQRRFGALNDNDYPEIFIVNALIPDVVADDSNQTAVRDALIGYAKKLESAGAEFIAVPCNTVTVFISQIRSAVSIPVLNIVEEVSARAQNNANIGLLATQATIRNRLYHKFLPRSQILTLDDQRETTKIILRTLAGKNDETDERLLCAQIAELLKAGAEKVILGCTELPLVVRNHPDVIDSLEVLAEITVEVCIEPIKK